MPLLQELASCGSRSTRFRLWLGGIDRRHDLSRRAVHVRSVSTLGSTAPAGLRLLITVSAPRSAAVLWFRQSLGRKIHSLLNGSEPGHRLRRRRQGDRPAQPGGRCRKRQWTSASRWRGRDALSRHGGGRLLPRTVPPVRHRLNGTDDDIAAFRWRFPDGRQGYFDEGGRLF